MTLPYENARSGENAYREIQKILDGYGCDMFGMQTRNVEGATLIQFEYKNRQISVKASWKGYAAAWLQQNPWSSRKQMSEKQWHEKAAEKGKIAVPSILRDWIKSQITMLEIQALTFDEAFLSHILLPGGERIIEAVSKDAKFLPSP
jgi:hypothetical protein